MLILKFTKRERFKSSLKRRNESFWLQTACHHSLSLANPCKASSPSSYKKAWLWSAASSAVKRIEGTRDFVPNGTRLFLSILSVRERCVWAIPCNCVAKLDISIRFFFAPDYCPARLRNSK